MNLKIDWRLNYMEEKIKEEFSKDWETDNTKEKLENLEKCIEMIKETLEGLDDSNVEDVLSEIKFQIKELEDV